MNSQAVSDEPSKGLSLSQPDGNNSQGSALEQFSLINKSGRVLLTDLIQRREELYRTDPKLGMVVGTFAAVPYVHLQLEARRRLYSKRFPSWHKWRRFTHFFATSDCRSRSSNRLFRRCSPTAFGITGAGFLRRKLLQRKILLTIVWNKKGTNLG